MPLITILTDWESSNTYLPQVYGSLYSNIPDCNAVSISPPVKPHQVARAAYILQHSLETFPDGTVHAVFVGMPVDFSKILIANIKQQTIITWDTGLISLLKDKDPDVYHYQDANEEGNNWLKPMIKAITLSRQNSSLQKWAKQTSDYIQLRQVEPILQRNQVLGNIIHIDPYGNAITNISRQWFEEVSKGRRFELYVQSNFNKITRINDGYEPHRIGELIALFNSQGYLEIALSHGNVSELLNLDIHSEIRIRFFNTIETV